MKAIVPYRTGKFKECQIGTLIGVRARTGTIDYAVVVSDPSTSNECKVAVLQDHDDNGPVPWFEMHHSENECFIFGNDWIFEIIAPADGENFLDTEALGQAGNVFIVEDLAAVYVGQNPHDGSFRPNYMDIRNWQRVDRPLNGLVGVSKRWMIWAGEAERTRIGGQPLVSFESRPYAR